MAGYDGPAAVLESSCAAVAANPAWDTLGLADREGRGNMPAELAAAVLACCTTGSSQRVSAKVRRAPDEARRSLQFVLVPATAAGRRCVLVLGQDDDMREALSDALVASRAFHRDLALCANDAIWQIDASGRIDYVGRGGMLGRTEEELCGMRLSDLVARRSENTGALLLSSREPVFDTELWLTERSGEERCFLVSAVPIFAGDGEWGGMRGVGRDVTEERAREAELAQMRRSHRLVDSVLHAMRSEARPEAMLQSAATVVVDSVGLTGCLVLMTPDGTFSTTEITANCYESESQAEGFRRHVAALTKLCQECLRGQDSHAVKARVEGWHVLLGLTRYGARLNGAVVFVRSAEGDAAEEAWSGDDGILLRAICDQVGVTIEQLQMYRDRRRRVS